MDREVADGLFNDVHPLLLLFLRKLSAIAVTDTTTARTALMAKLPLRQQLTLSLQPAGSSSLVGGSSSGASATGGVVELRWPGREGGIPMAGGQHLVHA